MYPYCITGENKSKDISKQIKRYFRTNIEE